MGIEAKESRREGCKQTRATALSLSPPSPENRKAIFLSFFCTFIFECNVALCEGKVITFALCIHAWSHSTRVWLLPSRATGLGHQKIMLGWAGKKIKNKIKGRKIKIKIICMHGKNNNINLLVYSLTLESGIKILV